MNWYLHSQNPAALQTLYPSAPPLKTVRVLRLSLSEDGPALSIAANLDLFPELVPARWHLSFSMAQVKISFWGVRELYISGWATTNVCQIEVDKSDSLIDFRLRSESCDVRGKCDFFRIDGIAGYATEAQQDAP